MKPVVTSAIAAVCLVTGVAVGALAQPKKSSDPVFAGEGVFNGIAHGPAGGVKWTYPATVDAAVAAPRNHRILFEDAKVILLEVTIRPGETEKVHGHRYPSVFAIDGVQPKGEDLGLNGEVRKLPARGLDHAVFPQCIAMGPQAPHQFHNMDTFPQHFYRLQFKKMDGQNMVNATYGKGS